MIDPGNGNNNKNNNKNNNNKNHKNQKQHKDENRGDTLLETELRIDARTPLFVHAAAFARLLREGVEGNPGMPKFDSANPCGHITKAGGCNPKGQGKQCRHACCIESREDPVRPLPTPARTAEVLASLPPAIVPRTACPPESTTSDPSATLDATPASQLTVLNTGATPPPRRFHSELVYAIENDE